MVEYCIEERVPDELPAGEVERAAALRRAVDLERAPDEPAAPLAVYRSRITHASADTVRRAWIALDGDGGLAAIGFVELPQTSNSHLAFIFVEVRQDARRRGLGRALVTRAAAAAHAAGRTLAMTFVDDRIAAGMSFARAIGLEVGSEMHLNQVEVARVDRARVHAFLDDARARSTEYEVELIPQPTPEALLADVCVAYDQMNNAPRDRLGWQDERATPEQLRERDALHQKQGRVRSLLVARRTSDRQIAGFTELTYLSEVPHIVQQHGTAVDPTHRGRSLGMRLKATNLLWVLDKVSGASLIRTGNADSNEAMLRINQALGFQPAFAAFVLQGPVDAVLARSSSSETVGTSAVDAV